LDGARGVVVQRIVLGQPPAAMQHGSHGTGPPAQHNGILFGVRAAVPSSAGAGSAGLAEAHRRSTTGGTAAEGERVREPPAATAAAAPAAAAAAATAGAPPSRAGLGRPGGQLPAKGQGGCAQPGMGGIRFGTPRTANNRVKPALIARTVSPPPPPCHSAQTPASSDGSSAASASGITGKPAIARGGSAQAASPSPRLSSTHVDDEDAELDSMVVRQESRSDGNGDQQKLLSDLVQKVQELTWTVEALKTEVKAAKESKHEAQDMAKAIERTGELQRFLDAEAQRQHDVRESLQEIKQLLRSSHVSAEPAGGDLLRTDEAAVSSKAPSSGSSGGGGSSSPYHPGSGIGSSPTPVLRQHRAGLRAVASHDRQSAAAVQQQATTARKKGNELTQPKRQQNSVADPLPVKFPIAASQLTNRQADNAPVKSQGRETRQASPLQVTKPPHRASDVAPNPQSDPTAVLPAEVNHQSHITSAGAREPVLSDDDDIRAGDTCRVKSRAVLRQGSDTQSMAMKQLGHREALNEGEDVVIAATQRVTVMKGGGPLQLTRVLCEHGGAEVGWTSVFAQNGNPLLEKMYPLKLRNLAGQLITVRALKSDTVETIKQYAHVPDANRTFVVLHGEQLPDSWKVSDGFAAAATTGNSPHRSDPFPVLHIVPCPGRAQQQPLDCAAVGPNGPGSSILHGIGEDLLVKVLRYLPSLQDRIAVTLTCQMLFSLRYVPALWETLDFSSPEDMTLLCVSRGTVRLPASTEDWHNTSDAMFCKVAAVLSSGGGQYRSTVAIKLQCCNLITDQSLRCMAHTYPRLRSLCLRGCSYVTCAGVRTLVETRRGLESLDIGYCDDALSDETVDAIVRHCEKLKTLVLRGGKKLGQSSAAKLGQWKGLESLISLDLMGCNRILTDGGLRAIFSSKSDALESLNISRRTHRIDTRDPREYKCSGTSKLSDTSLDLLSDACPQLKYLNLADASDLSNEGIERLLAKLPLLRSLDLHRCTKLRGTRVVAAVELHTPLIEELVLSGLRSNAKDKTMEGISQLKQLQKLDIHGCVCKDEALANVLRGCTALVDLSISCNYLSIDTLQKMLDAHLRALSLIGVNSWWQNHRIELAQALANAALSSITIFFDRCVRSKRTYLLYVNSNWFASLWCSDASMMNELQAQVAALIATQQPSTTLKPLSRRSEDELRLSQLTGPE
jgi:hypothetical protein